MIFQSVIFAPNQYEEHYRNIVAPTFKIGQSMEYATFFDTPERLFQFVRDVNQKGLKQQ